jgi:hypothetical protein
MYGVTLHRIKGEGKQAIVMPIRDEDVNTKEDAGARALGYLAMFGEDRACFKVGNVVGEEYMGRELRRVPLDYEHPTDREGRDLHPMFDEVYSDVLAEYEREKALWEKGEHEDQREGGLAVSGARRTATGTWEDWAGDPPDPAYYRQESWEGRELGIQLWENTTEGTPLSPVFADTDVGLRALAAWAAENATTFADFRASAEGWYEMLRENQVAATTTLDNGTTATWI